MSEQKFGGYLGGPALNPTDIQGSTQNLSLGHPGGFPLLVLGIQGVLKLNKSISSIRGLRFFSGKAHFLTDVEKSDLMYSLSDLKPISFGNFGVIC